MDINAAETGRLSEEEKRDYEKTPLHKDEEATDYSRLQKTIRRTQGPLSFPLSAFLLRDLVARRACFASFLLLFLLAALTVSESQASVWFARSCNLLLSSTGTCA